MQNPDQIKWNRRLLFLTGCFIGLYVVLRACFIGITDDEAWSYYNVKSFRLIETLCTGNTHWFNFGAIKVALLLGFEKAWQLRWFSVLSSLVFIYVGIAWIKTIQDLWTKLFAFAFLFLNHYLLEYLALARGYATGLAFMVLSLLFFVVAHNKNKERQFVLLSLVMAGLSAVANFNFFYYFSAFCCVYFYGFYFKNGFAFLRNKHFYTDLVYSGGVSLVIVNALLFITECSNDIAGFGGITFVDSIFGGFVERVVSQKIPMGSIGLNFLSFLFLCVILLAAYGGVFRLKKHGNAVYSLCSAILLLMLCLAFLTRNFFHVLYPTHRTALMFIPLFIVVLTYFVNGIQTVLLKKSISFIVVISLLFSFLLNVNFSSVTDYKEQSNAKAIYQSLSEKGNIKVGICPELYVVYLKYYSFQYSQMKGELINTMVPKPIQVQEANNHLNEFDFLILFPPYNLSNYGGDKIHVKGIMFYLETKALVVKVLKE